MVNGGLFEQGSADHAAADSAFWDAPPDAFEDGDDDGGLWPQNEPAVSAYLAVQSQLRFAPGGMGPPICLGLDYAGARVGLRFAGLKMTPDLWSDVQVIEAAVVDAMNRKNQ